MKIYLDYIFLENIIINFVIIYQVNILTKSKINIKRIIIASVVLAIYSVIICILQENFITNGIMKLIIINFVMIITFKSNSLSECLKKISYYYIVNFVYVGVIIAITIFFNISLVNIKVKIFVYLTSGIVTYLSNKYLWKLWKTNFKNNNLGYNLKIKDEIINCYVDTGNLVKAPIYNLDVIFLDYKWYGILELLDVLKNKVELNINTVNKNDKIYGYIVKHVEVYKNNKYICKLDKIIFSFSNQRINIDNKYSGLIGYDLYIEKLEGAKL